MIIIITSVIVLIALILVARWLYIRAMKASN
jgi:hypothetical protein